LALAISSPTLEESVSIRSAKVLTKKPINPSNSVRERWALGLPITTSV
jgi:hypothetical protein